MRGIRSGARGASVVVVVVGRRALQTRLKNCWTGRRGFGVVVVGGISSVKVAGYE